MVSDKQAKLVSLIADGKFHSGEKIGEAMGVSRAAVWKLIQSLAGFGLTVQAVTGRGYRLEQPLDILNGSHVLAQLSEANQGKLSHLEIHQHLTSTNSYLMQQASSGAASGFACLSEYQGKGRGRRGREWVSPYGSNIYLSLLWHFNDGASRLGGLSLAMAVAVMRTLNLLGLHDAGIKWPNDILVHEHKLAGILVEVAGESNGPCYAVIGVGLNYSMPSGADEQISQSWTDLHKCGVRQGRNSVAGCLINELLFALSVYEEQGLDAFVSDWMRWDLMWGRTVAIYHGDSCECGVARGIDERGLLLLQSEKGIQRYASGEVSLRPVSK